MHRKMVEGERESIEVFRNAKNYHFPMKLSVSVRTLFFFEAKAQRKKAWQKRNAARGFRALRSATKDAVFGNCDLLKKVDQNFITWQRLVARPMRSKTVAA